MDPKKLEVSTIDGTISILWSDGHVAIYSPLNLRRECPCAMCKGEPGVFGRHYAAEKSNVDPTVQPEEIESVGRYGLKIVWSDKHDLGISSFEYLRDLCECEECEISRNAHQEENE